MSLITLASNADLFIELCLLLDKKTFISLLSTCHTLSLYRNNVRLLSSIHSKLKRVTSKPFSLMRLTLTEIPKIPRCQYPYFSLTITGFNNTNRNIAGHTLILNYCSNKLESGQNFCNECMKAQQILFLISTWRSNVDSMLSMACERLCSIGKVSVLINTTIPVIMLASDSDEYVPIGVYTSKPDYGCLPNIIVFTEKQRSELLNMKIKTMDYNRIIPAIESGQLFR